MANTDQVRITHVDLHLTCDMRSSTIYGRAVYTISSLSPSSSSRIVLDTNHIKLISSSHPYKYQSPHPTYGSGLEIDLTGASDSFSLDFQTTESATAVQYLSPPQTNSKTHSYIYTQCQAIHCRSLFPCQDTPMVKFSINYHLTVPLGYNAVAAGIYQNTQDSIPGFKTFNYIQSIPVPSYLVAFACGNISSFTLNDPRFTFYAESDVLKAAVEEFSEIGKLLKAAEEIMTPYFWGKLDLLILPGSFPFGGMENPNLIFVTPSLLAGDKSLINVVAHEIAHSWTGNAVTNTTWAHFWLNEGFTVYFERKIVERVFGKDQAELEQMNGLTNLRKTVDLYGSDHNFTRLNLDIDSIDPDDAFSQIPYEKGCCFLLYLESLVGETQFLGFLREYVTNFQGGNCDSQEFKEFFLCRFSVDIDWETWLRGTGMPPWTPQLNSKLLNEVHEFLKDPTKIHEASNWCTEQFVALLEEINKNPSHDYVRVCEELGIQNSKNSEIRVNWLILVAKTKTEKYFADIAEFLAGIGRLKFTRPLFRALIHSDLRGLANQIFDKNKGFYHSTLVGLLHKEFGFAL